MAAHRVARIAVALLGGLVALALLAWLGIQAPAFRNWARGRAEQVANGLIRGDVTIGSLGGSLLSGVELRDVAVHTDLGEVVTIDRVGVTYAPTDLIGHQIVLRSLRLDHPRVTLIQTDAGWNLASLLEPRQPGAGPSQRGVTVETLEIRNARITIESRADAHASVRLPRDIDSLDVDAFFEYTPAALSVSVDSLAFKAQNPPLTVRAMSGGISRSGGRLAFDKLTVETARSHVTLDGTYETQSQPARLQLHMTSAPLVFAELSGIVPALERYRLAPSIDASLEGPLDALQTEASVHDPTAGRVDAQLVLDLAGPAEHARGSAITRELDLEPVLGSDRWKTSLSTTASIDLSTMGGWSVSALNGRFDVSGDDVEAFGFEASHLDASGRLADGTADVDASGRAYDATVMTSARLALGATPITYELTGHVASLNLRRLPPSVGAPRLDSRIDAAYRIEGEGSQVHGSLEFGDSAIEGAAVGRSATATFALGGGRPAYGFAGDVAHLDLQRFGRALSIAALDDARLASDISGRVAVDGAGAALATLRLHAQGTIGPSRLVGADVPSLTFDATLADKRLELSAQGGVQKLELGRAAPGRNLSGTMNAQFDLAGSIDPVDGPLDADSVSMKGRVAMDASRVDDLVIDRAEVAGSYAHRVAQLTTVTVDGPDLHVSASGPLSLAPGTSSRLQYSADATDLETLRALAGQDIGGTAHVEGTVTGDRDRLTASGPIHLTRFTYGGVVDTLTADGQYTLAMPDLDPSQVSVQASLNSTLLTLEGRELTSASATVEYRQRTLTFDTTLRQGDRTATAQGRAVIRTGQQEIHLQRLSLGTTGVVWANPTDRTIDIDYGEGVVRLDHVTLASDTQRITADGTLAIDEGRAGTLEVEATDVNLNALGHLLLLDRELVGRMNATATVKGGPTSRTVTGRATVQQGAVDQFVFDSLEASVEYAADVARLDATLVQQPGATLRVAGAVPIGGGGALDLHVTSTPIDLAVVRAATTALSGLTGTVELNAEVTGTLDAPQVQGLVNVADGGFTVEPTGVSYSGLQAQIQFDGDSATVRDLRIEDDGGDPLTVTGEFGVEGRRISDISVTAAADHFQVLENDIGNVAINLNLSLAGSLGSPRVDGSLRVDTGRLDVGTLLERVTANPYQTRPVAAEASAAAPSPGPWGNLTLNLSIEVPDNLILRGSDIRTTGGPALGSLNATVGGTFRLVKDPGGEIGLLGTVQTVRGIYEFQGRQFTLRRNGTIEFRSERPIDPALALTAEREVSGVVVDVSIGGTARDPKLSLSSDPPMSETDILSLIVFNQPANQLGEGQRASLGERAASLASGAVASALSQSLEEALNLTVFEVQTASAEAGGAPSVTIGKQINEALFVQLQQLFGAQQVSRLLIEYELNTFLRLQAEVSDGKGLANRSLTRRIERGGLDLVLYLRY